MKGRTRLIEGTRGADPERVELVYPGRARFASERGGPNEDTALTRGGVLTPSEVQLHST